MKVAGGAWLRWMEFVCAPSCEHYQEVVPKKAKRSKRK
jgi:hypothetical protein